MTSPTLLVMYVARGAGTRLQDLVEELSAESGARRAGGDRLSPSSLVAGLAPKAKTLMRRLRRCWRSLDIEWHCAARGRLSVLCQ